MGDGENELSGIRSAMSAGTELFRPISAEVDSDGRLVRADDALIRLHARSGGIEGGMLAIPALARLADLSIRLQMRLSRAVRVSDEAEQLELWVEVRPEGKLAKLNIISWHVLASLAKPRAVVDDDMPEIDTGTMRLDAALRMVHASGIATVGLTPTDFGRDYQEILNELYSGAECITGLIDLATPHVVTSGCTLTRISDDKVVEVTGEKLSDNYRLFFKSKQTPVDHAPAQSGVAPEAMFGKHLAPVLRQPLGRIIANAETIGSELQGPIRENYALYARDIANAARHLSALVDDLGDLEAIERADFKTAKDEIELGDVARRVAGLLSLKAADHSIVIETPDANIAVYAVAEFRRTLQILLNLVNNAIRYSPDGTQVYIEIAQVENWAQISVTDQGKGIALADHDKVFEKFERLGRSGDGGSGLGLYISRRLADAMGGELFVADTDSGGAKFTLRLPTV